jgi:polyhydroxybutyrate depolymerase
VVAATVVVLGVAACSSSDDAARSAGRDAQRSTTTTSRSTSTSASPAHASGPSAACEATPVVAPGTTDERLTSEGVERSYQLIVPDSYDGTKPYAIVFGLHSLTVDYRTVAPMAGFGDMDATYDFIGVSPSGLRNGAVPYWNAAPAEDNADVTFIEDLLDHLEATMCIDTGKVFSVGMSNGAQLASLLACRLPERITAIAPIAGVEYNDPCDGPPVPIMAFHGAEDPIVPYTGGGLNSVVIATQNLYVDDPPPGLPTPTGVDESMDRWAEHNGCDAQPDQEQVSPEVQVRRWSGCEAETVLYIVENGGHAWPGKPQPAFEAQFGHGTTEIDASALLFEFFFENES